MAHATLAVSVSAQVGDTIEGPLGLLVLYALLLVPAVVGLLALSAAGALRRIGQGGIVVDICIGVLSLGVAFQLFLVAWLTFTGRYVQFLARPLSPDASLYLSIMLGLGMGFLVIWLGTLYGLLKQADAHSDEVEEVNRKLRHRTEELEEFSYAVSHDLRSPLISLQWLVGELTEETDLQERERLAARIETNVGHMTGLVEDLLLLAQIEREGAVETTEEVVAVAHQALEGLTPISRRRGTRIHLLVAAAVQVNLPRVRLRQVLQNLVANAILHGREQGQVRVSCHETDVAGFIRLEVADDGPGVPEAEREAVFAAFTRGHRSENEGSGIGLALVRKIARAYGGRAWVESAPEGGACFCVLLPGCFMDPRPGAIEGVDQTVSSVASI